MEPATLLAPVTKPQSLKDIAYGTIKEAILTLKFPPGKALSNRELATQLTISETPIRDALQELEREGFVRRIPHKGTFVTEVDLDEIEETFRIRSVLEGLAVQMAAAHLDVGRFAELESLLLEAEAALTQGDRERCSAQGAAFHQCFIRWADSQRLSAILSNLDDHLERFRRISDLIDGRLEKSQGEHRQILETLKKRTAEEAGTAMRTHLESVLTDIQSSRLVEQ